MSNSQQTDCSEREVPISIRAAVASFVNKLASRECNNDDWDYNVDWFIQQVAHETLEENIPKVLWALEDLLQCSWWQPGEEGSPYDTHVIEAVRLARNASGFMPEPGIRVEGDHGHLARALFACIAGLGWASDERFPPYDKHGNFRLEFMHPDVAEIYQKRESAGITDLIGTVHSTVHCGAAFVYSNAFGMGSHTEKWDAEQLDHFTELKRTQFNELILMYGQLCEGRWIGAIGQAHTFSAFIPNPYQVYGQSALDSRRKGGGKKVGAGRKLVHSDEERFAAYMKHGGNMAAGARSLNEDESTFRKAIGRIKTVSETDRSVDPRRPRQRLGPAMKSGGRHAKPE